MKVVFFTCAVRKGPLNTLNNPFRVVNHLFKIWGGVEYLTDNLLFISGGQ